MIMIGFGHNFISWIILYAPNNWIKSVYIIDYLPQVSETIHTVFIKKVICCKCTYYY